MGTIYSGSTTHLYRIGGLHCGTTTRLSLGSTTQSASGSSCGGMGGKGKPLDSSLELMCAIEKMIITLK